RRVGVTGVPSDDAVLHSTVRGAGGDPSGVRTVTIGFNAVSSLLAGRVAAATAFWNIEGVALARQRPDFHPFKVDDYGAPPYPELVVSVTRATLEHRRATIRRVLRALARGYAYAARNPTRSARSRPRADPERASYHHPHLPRARPALGAARRRHAAGLGGLGGALRHRP